ncbi:MAG: hypothetical protein HZC40_14080 [Chloroflexi bacterium]|nr:hypothetical protein [Chloroflexota bacterium]
MNIFVLFFIICAFQTALIHFQHFSPFEREMNLRAVLWGAQPGARYWAVLALDVLTGLLLAFLVLALVPMSPRDEPVVRALRFIPAWIIVSLLAAILHSRLTDALIRFPNYGLIARKMIVVAMMSVIVVAATLGMICIALTTNYDVALDLVMQLAPTVFISAMLITIFVFALRALAFVLRVLPVIGAFLQATVSTLALIWTLAQFARMLMANANEGWIWQARGFAGIEVVVIALAALALIALIAAWRLEPARHADALDPPPLVIREPAQIKPSITIGDAHATISTDQLRVEIARDPFAFRVINARGDVLLDVPPNGLTRDLLLQQIIALPILYTGNTMKTKWRAWSSPLNRVTKIEPGDHELRIPFRDAALRFSFYANDILRIEFQHSSRFTPHASLAFDLTDDAHILGLGQRFNKIDQRGEETYFFVEEGGVGYAWMKQRVPWLYPLAKKWFGARGSFPNGEQCTGFPVPFALIAREQGASAGLFWNTYRPSWFSSSRITHAPRASRITVLDNHLDLFLYAGPTPLDAIQQYTALTGRSETPPPWVFLPWKTNTGAVVEDDVRTDIRKFRELKIPLAQVGIEHWQEVRGSYEFSKTWWRNIDDLIATAATHRAGIRHGYFIRNRLGLPYQQRIFHGIATVIDYTNPRASAWHQKIVAQTFHARGIHAVMTDYAESIPPDAIFYNGQSGVAMRNAYPVIYCDAMQRAARSVLGDDHLLYPRAGYAGSQRFVAAQWPGDQDTDWDDGDGLPAAVRAMINASICGFPVHGSDVGGWYGCRRLVRLVRADHDERVVLALGRSRMLFTVDARARRTDRTQSRTVEIRRRDDRDLSRAVRRARQTFSVLLFAGATRDARRHADHPASRADLERLRGTVRNRRRVDDRRRAVRRAGDRTRTDATRNRFTAGRVVGCAIKSLGARSRKNFGGCAARTITGKTGSLDDDLEMWLYADPNSRAAFELFDGTILREGEPCARRVEWKIFRA